MQLIEIGKQLSRLSFRRSFLISRSTSDNSRIIVKGGRDNASLNNYSNLDNEEKGNLLRFSMKFSPENNNQEDVLEVKLMTDLSGQETWTV
jgi:hypothetical protein